MEAPVVRMPDPKKPYIIKTDASQFGIGAILAQKDDDGTDRVRGRVCVEKIDGQGSKVRCHRERVFMPDLVS
jgi:hypothetical protein